MRKKHYQNVERGFFSHSPRFCFSRTTLYAPIHCLIHIHTTSLHLSSFPLLLHSFLQVFPSCFTPPSLTFALVYLSVSLSFSLNLGVSFKFKFKFKQLHWHDKRESRLGSFSMPGPSQSNSPWPSNLWSGLEYRAVWCWGGAAEPCLLGQICGQPHYGDVSVMFVWGTALTGFLCLELHRLPLSFDLRALLLVGVKCVSVKKFMFETKGFVGVYSCYVHCVCLRVVWVKVQI